MVSYFVKDIAKPGKFMASTPTGERQETEFTSERLAKQVDTFNKMRQAGIKVPAPFKHRIDSLPLSEEEAKKFETNEGSYHNGGFWDSIWIDTTTGKMMGKLAVYNDEDAKKISTSIQEVSPYIKPKHVDGHGKEWDDAIMHVALVNQPIDHDQNNFEPFVGNDGASAEGYNSLPEKTPVGLAFWLADEVVGQQPANTLPVDPSKDKNHLQNAISILRQMGLVLPDDTTEENFLERIVMSGQQKVADDQAANAAASGQGTTTTPPKNSGTEPTPVAMSHIQAENTTLKKQNEVMLSFLARTQQNSFKDRITHLINTGRIAKSYAEQKLLPLLNGFQMSLTDSGNIARCDLDNILDALEATPAMTGQITAGGTVDRVAHGTQFSFDDKGGLVEEKIPQEYLGNAAYGMSSEDVDAVVKDQLSASNL